jgi:hypothetical protein
MRTALSIILLISTTGCAHMGPDRGARSDLQVVCRPGHAVRFTIPANHPIPPAYRSPRRGSCHR